MVTGHASWRRGAESEDSEVSRQLFPRRWRKLSFLLTLAALHFSHCQKIKIFHFMPRILFVSGFDRHTRARDLAYEFERSVALFFLVYRCR